MSGIMMMLAGAVRRSAILPSTMTVTDERTSPSTASFTLNTSGLYSSVGNISSVSGVWKQGPESSNYEARATVNSGSLSSGTTNSWLSLSSNRTWSVLDSTGSGPLTANVTIEIRDAATLTVYTTSTLSLSAWQTI